MMYLFLVTSSLASIFLTVSSAATLSPWGPLASRTDGVTCENIDDYGTDLTCIGADSTLMIPDYWLDTSKDLDDNRAYNNFEKIICGPNVGLMICAFVEGGQHDDATVLGSQLKELFQQLAFECDRSRCGSIDLNKAEGRSKTGTLKIDSVNDVAGCFGIC